MNKVTVVATYGDRSIRSARMEVQLPSVIALKVGVGCGGLTRLGHCCNDYKYMHSILADQNSLP